MLASYGSNPRDTQQLSSPSGTCSRPTIVTSNEHVEGRRSGSVDAIRAVYNSSDGWIRERLSANDTDGFPVLVNTSSPPRLGKSDADLDGRSVLELTEGVGLHDG